MYLRCWNRAARPIRASLVSQARHASSGARSRIHVPPPFPIIESCPSPTCACRAAPKNLDIDREEPLNGKMAAYAEQVIVSTGRDDWSSRIEDEEHLAKSLKGFLGRGGKFSDPFHNVLVTNSSFQPSTSAPTETSVYLLPSFRYIPSISIEPSVVETFVKGFLKPTKLHSAHNVLSETQKEVLTRDSALETQFANVRDVNEILVLICGHGGRDERCGIMGPLLRSEFEEKLQKRGIRIGSPPLEDGQDTKSARVGLISHIGGHKFAGNVIIYIPPSLQGNTLAGTGIWYGRVAPEHVEGIVDETIFGGRVIRDMFRGGIKQGGELLRL
ncbi:sucrose cleavage family protein [Mytilinidion resinicola]|uniref:Altered inheritance of mitochondria protein 32 n=1 Tax=Mytilinidion resinicola TaxID=574789 RepID=A0A6A6YTG1_9PEZI|nr:sucrose cleavage family protein [Mytilinidion resinicola]KAF2811809.1 sucrose cleavage family protein [Mytilinidion resinicola]